jgi:hypothetical protein
MMPEKLFVPVEAFLDQCATHKELAPHFDSIKEAVSSVAVRQSDGNSNGNSLPDFLTKEPEDDFDREWQNNYKYLIENSEELSQKYPGKFIAVLNEQVYMVGDNCAAMAGKIYRKLGEVPLVVDIPGEKQPEQLDLPLC